MKFKLELSVEPKKYNLSNSKSLNIDESEIPTLIPKDKLKIIQAGDPDPYYKLQEIDITREANGLEYTPEFWKSYLKKLKARPIPGSRDGHHLSIYSRPPTDLYLIGGKVSDDNKKVQLKNYIPKLGESGDNAAFIRDSKADMIHFSIVAFTKDKVYRNDEGYIDKIEVIESIKGERNDAVEYGLGAMKQKTNKEGRSIHEPGLNNAKARIKAGDIDTTSSWTFSVSDKNKLSDTDFEKWYLAKNIDTEKETKAKYSYPFGKNGKVYKSAIVAIRQRSEQQDNTIIFNAAGQLLETIDNKSNKMEVINTMELSEIIKQLNNMKVNGSIDIDKFSKEIGIEVLTVEHIEAIETIDEINKLLNTDECVDAVKRLLVDAETVKKESFTVMRTNKLIEAFGHEKINDKENLKRNSAEMLVTKEIVTEDELDKQIENAKQNSIVKSFSNAEADYTSEQNKISGKEISDPKLKGNNSEFIEL